MKTMDVIMVRIYITESSHLLNKIVTYLKTDVKIRGISVFRAIRPIVKERATSRQVCSI